MVDFFPDQSLLIEIPHVGKEHVMASAQVASDAGNADVGEKSLTKATLKQ